MTLPEACTGTRARRQLLRPRRRQLAGAVRITVYVVAWVVVGVLGLVAVLRLVAWDALEPLAVANALTVVVYVPAWFVAVGAVVGRRWWLACAAVVVVAAQVAFVAPEILAARPVPAWTRHATTIRLLDANVDKSMDFEPGYVRAVRRDRPDVMTFEEFTPPAWRALLASGVLDNFPYRCEAAAYGAVGFLVASRLRLTDCRVHTVPWNGLATPYMVSATLWLSGRPFAFRLVHTLAPFPAYWHEWVAALAAVGASVRDTGTTHMLMVGDFNATWGNRGFAALLAAGLTDGAAARADALEMTWPNGAIVPPFVRIDHVLTGTDLAVTAVGAHAGFGSDHRYLLATVAVQP